MSPKSENGFECLCNNVKSQAQCDCVSKGIQGHDGCGGAIWFPGDNQCGAPCT